MTPDPASISLSIADAAGVLRAFGAVFEPLTALAALAVAGVSVTPRLAPWRRRAVAAAAVLLACGEAMLAWFHWRLYALTPLVDPITGAVTGTFAVPLWIESEKLYVWALLLAVLALLVRDRRDELLPGIGIALAALMAGAVLWGRPFTEPLPEFLGRYLEYAAALATGSGAAGGLFQGLEGSRQYYYNTWYMWVHPPMLFASYGAFVISFVATLLTIARRHSSYERVAYKWAAFGYLPLTAGMLLGFPWAIMAWQGDSWWWSGKVNISIMMWLLYTAYLHARLYLRRPGVWKLVAVLGVLAFVALVLTYIATYVVPGAHSYA